MVLVSPPPAHVLLSSHDWLFCSFARCVIFLAAFLMFAFMSRSVPSIARTTPTTRHECNLSPARRNGAADTSLVSEQEAAGEEAGALLQ